MNAAQITFAAGLAAVLVVSTSVAVAIIAKAREGSRFGEHAELGRATFLLHRISGLAIFAFLALHILDVGLYSLSPRLYNEVQPLYGTPILRIFECGLLFAVLFHTANGLRLVAFDAIPDAHWPQRLLPGVIAVSIVGGLAGSALILKPVLF